MTHPVRVLVWNLKDGGLDDGDDARLRQQIDVMAAAEPDIVCLTECRWPSEDKYRETRHMVEGQLGMTLSMARSNNHRGYLAIGFRPPYRPVETRHENGPQWWTTVARLRLTGAPYGPFDVAAIHFAPSSPTWRQAEAEALETLNGPRLIVAGDFNAESAWGPERDLDSLPPELREQARRKMDRGPAQTLEAAGWIDTAHQAGLLIPTVDHPYPYDCDRIYLARFDPAAVIDCQVLDSRGLSDHRPKVAIIDLAIPPPQT